MKYTEYRCEPAPTVTYLHPYSHKALTKSHKVVCTDYEVYLHIKIFEATSNDVSPNIITHPMQLQCYALTYNTDSELNKCII